MTITLLLFTACEGKSSGSDNIEPSITVEKSFMQPYGYDDDPVQWEITESAVREINQNSYFGYDFLSPYDEDIKEKIQKECGDGISDSKGVYYQGDGITWSFSGYPHDESDNYLTYIRFYSDGYNVFGIKPGDDVSGSMESLEKQGFEYVEERNEEEWSDKVYEKGFLYIVLSPNSRHHSDYENEDYSIVEEIHVGVRWFLSGNRTYKKRSRNEKAI